MIYIVLVVVVGAVAVLTAWLNSPGAKGRRGEAMVERTLARLDPGEYRVLHNVTLPTTGGHTTQIDHVVISRYGIFVLETKHLAGWVFGKAGDAKWTQSFGRHARNTFQNPLRQNHAHVKALQTATGLGDEAFESLVIMTGKATFKTGIPKGVLALRDLMQVLRAMPRQRLTDTQVKAAVNAIEAARLAPGPETDREHIETTVRRHGAGNGMVATASKLYFRGLAINIGLKLIGVALMIAVAWFAYQRISDITTDYAESQLTGKPAATQPAPETAPPTPVPATSPVPETTPPTTAETTPEPEPAPAPTDIRNRMPKDVRCAYSPDTDRCACLDPRGFKYQAALEQCKARALGEA
ncbi:NERD domain-containing protein [Marinihelvus fidelis]|uniref:NERD domain-containing protein n=1 Tax=Marinihelvus fidelis TaxID=2613842 RepID=A0A5N0T9V0_9GAMM|nr:nuclease-related domain-containing protein [Marinihelvus fidelis]KAA9131541.1 NERD domain-containing protein [Marinihelvus fidelis]